MEDDIQILEPKEYTPKENQIYSHSTLVMTALKKAQENRAKEMRDGYWNTKFDRFGNAHKVWVEDSREVFIESVKALMMIQERDYDDDIKNKLKEINQQMENSYKEYCEMEKKEWNEMHLKHKASLNSKGFYYRKGMLSLALPYKFEYVRYQVKVYSNIVSEIQKLIKRLGDYQEEIYEA